MLTGVVSVCECASDWPVAEDLERERRNRMITMVVMLLVGTIVGIAVVLWFIQHSVDVQKALGLRGRYVELVNMAKE